MKILHVLQSSRFSGAENVACQIISMLDDRKDIEFAYTSRDGDIRNTLAEKKIRFFPLKEMHPRELSAVIKEFSPDIIHAHDMLSSVFSAVAAPRSVKIISHIHNSDFRARRISVKSLLYLMFSPRFSDIIWVSRSCFEGFAFHKALKHKSRILYNVINREEILKRAELDTADYDYDFSYIGRLADPKNPLRFLRIAALVKKEKPDFRAAIVGTGELEDEVKGELERLGLKDNVVMHGFMSNPIKIIQCSKVLTMTSDREGTPMASLEAMALGVPIISTPTDGLCDFIVQGENGYLEKDEEEFSRLLLRVISDASLRERLSDAILNKFFEINDTEGYKGVFNAIYAKR